MKIKLIADSTCDLSDEFIQKHDIRIAPLTISANDKIFTDGVDISQKEIFSYDGICKTSAVNVSEYLEIYTEERAKCDAIIHFTISAEMSACYQNALVAAKGFDNIYIIDTRNLSGGIAHLVLDAAELISQNMPAKEIYEEMLQRLPLLETSFLMETLTYLHRGGRCSAMQAFASGMLKIKLSIVAKDGVLNVVKKYRGNLKSVYAHHIRDLLAENENIDTRRLLIAHTIEEKNLELLEMVKSLIMEILPFDEIHDTRARGTVSCHCGPNSIGISFYRKKP